MVKLRSLMRFAIPMWSPGEAGGIARRIGAYQVEIKGKEYHLPGYPWP